ncbi:MAG: hypothetical protein IK066_05275 [Kiritimatiellae bacterium]|nr:hypothetical protein [Kiritimatiellia bacterium]
MKKTILAVAAVAALAAATAPAGLISDEPAEVSAQAQVWLPGEGDFNLFEVSPGVQVSWREWVSFPFGLGLQVGVGTWGTDSGSDPYKYKGLNDFRGDVTVVPVGLTLAYCPIDWNNWDVILETGLHYVFVSSDADCRVEDGTRHDLEMDNAVWWTVGAEFDYQLAEGVYIVGGAGVQVDVVGSDTECNGADLRDTRFQSFYGKLGAKFLL